MTDGEKLVWAATYAASYEAEVQKHMELGTRVEALPAIENASLATLDLRDAHDKVRGNFGPESEVYEMYKEMLS